MSPVCSCGRPAWCGRSIREPDSAWHVRAAAVCRRFSSRSGGVGERKAGRRSALGGWDTAVDGHDFSPDALGLGRDWHSCDLAAVLLFRRIDFAYRSDCCARDASPRRGSQKCAGAARGRISLNDGVGAVVFLACSMHPGCDAGCLAYRHYAGVQGGGGLALGVLSAWIVSSLMRLVHAYQVEILLTLALALAGYAAADAWQLSAPLEAVAAGLRCGDLI